MSKARLLWVAFFLALVVFVCLFHSVISEIKAGTQTVELFLLKIGVADIIGLLMVMILYSKLSSKE